jgi:hypothetical protein
MNKIIFLSAMAGAALSALTAQAQGLFGALSNLGAVANGMQQSQMQAQQSEALRLQNELLRLQIERERAAEQAREEAYARALAQQQALYSTQPQQGGGGSDPPQYTGTGQPEAPKIARGARVTCQYYISPGVCGAR